MNDLADVTVFHLEMNSPSKRHLAAPEGELQVLEVASPSVLYYRFLYNQVGEDFRWLSRRKMTDEELAAVIQHPGTRMYVLHLDGSPAGFCEIDARNPEDIEIVQFGLMTEYHGRGFGTWFLNWILEQTWSARPQRVWLHTCTFDHPAALHIYQKAGFQLFKTEQIQREY